MYDISKRSQPITIARIVVVRTAITVDIAEVIRVVEVRGTLPPIVGRVFSLLPHVVLRLIFLISLSVRLLNAL